MSKLVRSTSNKMVGGVCAGIARYFGWKSSTVRLLFVLSCLLPGPQFLIYIVMWIFIPREQI